MEQWDTKTNIRHEGVDRSVEQPIGGRMPPVFVVGRELNARKMAGDAGHCDLAVAPWRTEVKGKRVVFDVPKTSIVLVLVSLAILSALFPI